MVLTVVRRDSLKAGIVTQQSNTDCVAIWRNHCKNTAKECSGNIYSIPSVSIGKFNSAPPLSSIIKCRRDKGAVRSVASGFH